MRGPAKPSRNASFLFLGVIVASILLNIRQAWLLSAACPPAAGLTKSDSADMRPVPRRQDTGKEGLQVAPVSKALEEALHTVEVSYEANKLHQKQRFLGVRFGQHPLDALVLQEVVFDVKPDLIIETGTNSGGSALYFSFLLEAINPTARVATVDMVSMSNWHGKWGEAVDPRDWRFWRRVVPFEGSSLAPDILAQMRAMAANATTVLVVLDSNHEYTHVAKEIAAYCPLVTVGSYCVVEDTKLGDPLRAANEFLARSKGVWENDGQREYLQFSQHKGGWLKRLARD